MVEDIWKAVTIIVIFSWYCTWFCVTAVCAKAMQMAVTLYEVICFILEWRSIVYSPSCNLHKNVFKFSDKQWFGLSKVCSREEVWREYPVVPACFRVYVVHQQVAFAGSRQATFFLWRSIGIIWPFWMLFLPLVDWPKPISSTAYYFYLKETIFLCKYVASSFSRYAMLDHEVSIDGHGAQIRCVLQFMSRFNVSYVQIADWRRCQWWLSTWLRVSWG